MEIIISLIATLSNALWNGFSNYWFEGLLVMIVVFGRRILDYLQERRAWKGKDFLFPDGPILFQLNNVQLGHLLISTVLEDSLRDVIHNRYAIGRLLWYARQTSKVAPVLPLPDTRGTRVALAHLVNAMSEAFRDGVVLEDMGLPVLTRKYWLCLTCERETADWTTKLRCLLIEQRELETLPAQRPQAEISQAPQRWRTLQAMQRVLQEHPYRFASVRISVPANFANGGEPS